MKLSIQQTLLPGADLKERFLYAAEYGFTGVELAAWGFDGPIFDYLEEIEAAKQASGLAVSSLCPSAEDDLVHPDPVQREKRLQTLVEKLKFADTLGARGAISLPIRPPLHLPDLSPVGSEHDLITQLTLSMLGSALEQTSTTRASIMLEPLNRYEAYYLKTVAQAAALCEGVGDARVQVMADLFHMSIEEANIAVSLKNVIQHVGHVHLADSNRLEPGQGHTDFVEPFRVLRSHSFDGWFALECRLSGNADEALPITVRFIHQCWDQAQS